MLVDSWTWVEIFTNSKNASSILDSMRSRELFVSSLALAEIAFWCMRNGKNPTQHLETIKRNCVVLIVDEKSSEMAGKALETLRKKSPGMGMIDAIVYSQGIISQIPVLTGDPDFRDLEGVEFIE